MSFIVVLITTIFLRYSIALNLSNSDSTRRNESVYVFESVMDNSVITVDEDGDVSTEIFTNSKYQRWTVHRHPHDADSLEFKNSIVPFNMLSGYEDPIDNPGIFPRPLGLADRGKFGQQLVWNIRIRGRWCIQANGVGFPMDIDDCESFTAPWQLWLRKEVK